jgi:hypothetical protein
MMMEKPMLFSAIIVLTMLNTLAFLYVMLKIKHPSDVMPSLFVLSLGLGLPTYLVWSIYLLAIKQG